MAADRLTYTLDEACAMLGISMRTARRLLAAGEELHPDVPAIRVGGRWKVARHKLDILLGIDVEEIPADPPALTPPGPCLGCEAGQHHGCVVWGATCDCEAAPG